MKVGSSFKRLKLQKARTFQNKVLFSSKTSFIRKILKLPLFLISLEYFHFLPRTLISLASTEMDIYSVRQSDKVIKININMHPLFF